MTDAYQQLRMEMHKIRKIQIALASLQWDQETMMPSGSAAERGDVVAELAVLAHEKSTDKKIDDLIQAVDETALTDIWDKRNGSMMKKNHALSKALPEKLVHDLSLQTSHCHEVWKTAKEKNDWEIVRPELEKLFVLIKQQAEIFGEVLHCAPYDALLSRNAEGNSQALVDPLFAQLKSVLPGLMQEIVAKQKARGPVKEFTIGRDRQEVIAKKIAEILGFDFNRGRLDISVHPFSTGTRQDSRITTSYQSSVIDAIYSVAHEVGHSVYTQQSNEKYQYDDVGQLNNMVLHESQSLLFEKQVAYGADFISVIYDVVAKLDPNFSAQGSVDEFRDFLHVVTPSFIRTQADEVTYPLHVIFRYEIEKMLFDGGMQIKDLPQVWNAKVKEYLGLDVPSLAQGCLQDTHWFHGMFGYFPTYTQGALASAQIFQTVKKELPDIQRQIRARDVGALKKYLGENIHHWSMLYTAPELIERVTGEQPDARFFLAHLQTRYL